MGRGQPGRGSDVSADDPIDQWSPCARGPRCARVQVIWDGGRAIRQGQASPRALCDADRDLLIWTLDQLAEMYRLLVREMTNLRQAPPTQGTRVSGTPDAQIPLRLDVDALLREVASKLQVMIDQVHERSRYNGPSWTMPGIDSGTITSYCTRLGALVDVLLTLQDAAEHANSVFDLYHRVRSALGFNGDRVRIPGVCAACDARGTLVRWDTDPDLLEGITCTNCGHTQTRDDYARQAERLAALTTEEHA